MVRLTADLMIRVTFEETHTRLIKGCYQIGTMCATITLNFTHNNCAQRRMKCQYNLDRVIIDQLNDLKKLYQTVRNCRYKRVMKHPAIGF